MLNERIYGVFRIREIDRGMQADRLQMGQGGDNTRHPFFSKGGFSLCVGTGSAYGAYA